MRYLRIQWLLLILLMGASHLAAADSLEAIADRHTISINETLNFRLVYEGRQSNDDPDLSLLTPQFEVLSNQKSMQHSIINGAVSASTEWRLVLAPRNTGQVLIPPFTVNGQRSDPLTITVTEASKDPISGQEDVFLETVVDKSNAYVQEQILITYRLYYNRSVESLDAQQLELADARVEALPRVDYQKTLGHTQYGVAEYKYAVFADASGTVHVPAQTWTVRTTDQPSMSRFGFNGGRYKLHRVKTEALNIEVAPKPDQFPNSAIWLPAQKVTLTEAWSLPPENFKVGEPITRTVTLRASGAPAEHLAPIFTDKGTADFKFYPDKPNQDNRLTDSGVVGTRTESVAIVPSRSGELTLPAIEVTWWNTETQQIEVATLPPHTINVTGPAATALAADTDAVVRPSVPATEPTPSSSTISWFWVVFALISVIGNVVLLALLLHRSKPSPPPNNTAITADVDPTLLFKKVRQACDRRSPARLRSALLQWSTQRWGQNGNSLSKVGQISGDTALIAQLHALDAVLFAGAEDKIDYLRLKAQLEELNKKHQTVKPGGQLKPLYGSQSWEA